MAVTARVVSGAPRDHRQIHDMRDVRIAAVLVIGDDGRTSRRRPTGRGGRPGERARPGQLRIDAPDPVCVSSEADFCSLGRWSGF
jgi:hypothetical protein